MKLRSEITIVVLLSLAIAATSRDTRKSNDIQVQEPEEREIITREKLDAYLASKDDNTGDIVDIAKTTLESINTLAQIDFSQSGGQIAWEVANAIIPLIGAALAFIPGVGVIVSGVFLGLWSLISPIFAPKKDNPMEKMIKELAEKMNKKMDEKLSNLVNLAIYGEIARNNYICNKYNYISQSFSEEYRTNTSLQIMDAINLKIYLNDCDNFLKDTAEAFVYDDYADVLWVPGAITTSVRLAFLAELIKNGHLMGLTRKTIVMYFQELKKDTQRQFEFHSKAMDKIHDRIRHKKYDRNDKNIDYIKGVSSVERASCSLQSQFYYFDREIYSYGMPTILNSTDMFSTIKMANHYKPSESNGSKIKHLQIFFNVTDSKFPSNLPERKDPYLALEFMNCFLGPMYLRSPNVYWFNFHPMPENHKYSYEFRVMYLEKKIYNHGAEYQLAVPSLSEVDKDSTRFEVYKTVSKKINKNLDLNGRTHLNIEFIYPDHKRFNDSKKLIDIPSPAHWKKCPYVSTEFVTCNTFVEVFLGRFKMYSAGTFNHKSETLSPLISIDDPRMRARYYQNPYSDSGSVGFIVGIEIILRPSIV